LEEKFAEVNKRLDEMAKPKPQLAEAEWDTEYINNLPDEALAYIEPGGTKDEQGKTVPRSLRHLPYKNAQGNLDADHVRNALARLDQIQISAEGKASERVFPTTYANMDVCFIKLKRRAARSLQNPRLLNVTFTTFRDWGATMTYHYTRKLLLVQQLLGHKNIQNTLRYTRPVHFKEDEFEVETAATIEEAKELLKVGFDYIAEKNSIMLFRRPKRFGSLSVINEA